MHLNKKALISAGLLQGSKYLAGLTERALGKFYGSAAKPQAEQKGLQERFGFNKDSSKG